MPSISPNLSLDLAETIALVEHDFPPDAYSWFLGVCACGDPAGHYRAGIGYEGTPSGITVIEIDLGAGTAHRHQHKTGGWTVDAHGSSPLLALQAAYGLALQRKKD